MKVKRYKHCRKYLGFYRNNFNFREPHQVLVDGTFSQLALKNKINIKEQLPKYLGGDVQVCWGWGVRYCLKKKKKISNQDKNTKQEQNTISAK